MANAARPPRHLGSYEASRIASAWAGQAESGGAERLCVGASLVGVPQGRRKRRPYSCTSGVPTMRDRVLECGVQRRPWAGA
jgi:hypothetical protein